MSQPCVCHFEGGISLFEVAYATLKCAGSNKRVEVVYAQYASWKEAYACLVWLGLSGFGVSFGPIPNLFLGSLFKVVFDRQDSIVNGTGDSGFC
jgi:hypothetical protein